MAGALACKAELTTEQAWYETYLLIRLLHRAYKIMDSTIVDINQEDIKREWTWC